MAGEENLDTAASVRGQKSSAVIEVVGGGEGGQRRESNVLKRYLISGALLILLWKCEDLAVWTSVEKDERKDL